MKDQSVGEIAASALHNIKAEQSDDGSWPAPTFGGPQSTALVVIGLRWMGELTGSHDNACCRWMATTQLPDGGFPGVPNAGQGDLLTTMLVYGAMKGSTDPAVITAADKARVWINQHGGIRSMDAQSNVFLAIAGLIDKDQVKNTLVAFKLMPGIDRLMGRKFGLFTSLAANAMVVMSCGVRYGEAAFRFIRHPLQWLTAGRFYRYFERLQNPDGDWGGVSASTLWGLMALKAMGIGRGDAMYTRALTRLEAWVHCHSSSQIEYLPFRAGIWNTALALRVRMKAGESLSAPGMVEGLAWLAEMQGKIPQPAEWQNPGWGAPRTGGWAFETGNPYGSDPDSSGAVLTTLAMARQKAGFPDSARVALDRGLDWILAMQNACGGWPSFTHGQPQKPPGPLFRKPPETPSTLLEMLKALINPPFEIADPAWEDESGRILYALGQLGWRQDHASVSAAAGFLKQQRGSNGVWWGRWEINYCLSTAYILSGLAAVGIDDSKAWVAEAIEWLIQHQNPDGGWGDPMESYAHPELAGQGESQTVVTGKVLTALSLHGYADSPVALRAVTYLCREYESGGWSNRFPVGVVVPPIMLYTNWLYSQFTPLEGLLTYLEKKKAA